MTALRPAAAPCKSCPYRCDVPSGVWDEAEYEKLPRYDGPTMSQPPGLFLCHQQNGCLCAGWVGCHDMPENLAIRIASLNNLLDLDDIETIFDYESPVPLFASGAEAAEHGLAEVEAPGAGAVKTIQRLAKKRDADT